MADQTLAKLVSLIAASEPAELRHAAITVAGNVGTERDEKAVSALLDSLHDADLDLRVAAIEALGRLRADEALGPLQEFVQRGGAEVEPSVRALGQLGTRTQGAEQDRWTRRRRPCARASQASWPNRAPAAASSSPRMRLLDPDPKVVDAAAKSLATEVPSFSAAQKQALARFLSEALAAKRRSGGQDGGGPGAALGHCARRPCSGTPMGTSHGTHSTGSPRRRLASAESWCRAA